MHDPRIARFFAVDPLAPSYPELTPYQFASNTPIWAEELEGLEANYTNDGNRQAEGVGPTAEVSGPLSDSYASDLGYTSYGILEPNYTFSDTEMKDIETWYNSNSKIDADYSRCLETANLFIQNFLSSDLNPSGSGSAIKTGLYLVDKGYASLPRTIWAVDADGKTSHGISLGGTPVGLKENVGKVISSIAGSSSGTSAFLASMGGGYHTSIIFYNPQKGISLGDQGALVTNGFESISNAKLQEVTFQEVLDSRNWQLYLKKDGSYATSLFRLNKGTHEVIKQR